MSVPERDVDRLAPVTKGELHDELRDIRESLKHVATKEDLVGRMGRIEERLVSIENHGATQAGVERMGRLMLMWVVGVVVALVGIATTVILAVM